MQAQRRDDDPTRALDDFFKRHAPAVRAVDAAPDLSGLGALLHPERAEPPRPKGGVLKNGTAWDVDDVVDVPVVLVPDAPEAPTDMPRLSLPQVDLAAESAQSARLPQIDLPSTELPEPPDAQTASRSTAPAREFAAAQWLAEARQAEGPTPQPSALVVPGRARPNPRVLAQWQPGAWIATSRLAVEATTEFINTPSGPAVETYPGQYLVAVWAPGAGGQSQAGTQMGSQVGPQTCPQLGRWPLQARLCAEAEAQLSEAVLADIPGNAPLWWLPPGNDLADWALVAEVVLIHEPSLRPFQTTALRALIDHEREAAFARINQAYHLPQAGGPVLKRS